MPDTKLIPLTQGKFAIVDAADYDRLMQWKWCAYRAPHTFYAHRSESHDGKMRSVKMHRQIMGAAKGQLVDHIDHDGLDNRRSNLRLCNKSENGRNRRGADRRSSSKYLGVCWDSRKGKWLAQIKCAGRASFIGHFSSEIEAAMAYDAAARSHHGEFASPNFKEQAA